VYDGAMPSKHAAFVQYVAEDILSDIDVKTRPMFGGHGFYHDGKMFGLEADGKIYFKVSDKNRTDYEQVGSEPFTYAVQGKKTMTMSYWTLPEEVLENRELAVEWANKAIRVAFAAKKK